VLSEAIQKKTIINIGCSLPPTIRLQPTRNYVGSPIATKYTISFFSSYSDTTVSPPDKKELINMMFWVSEVFPELIDTRPTMSIPRQSVFKDGEILLQVGLGQPINISLVLYMRPPRRINRISVVAIQAVDVAMFSSGYFKNEVAAAEERRWIFTRRPSQLFLNTYLASIGLPSVHGDTIDS
jgi:hypothetical protein